VYTSELGRDRGGGDNSKKKKKKKKKKKENRLLELTGGHLGASGKDGQHGVGATSVTGEGGVEQEGGWASKPASFFGGEVLRQGNSQVANDGGRRGKKETPGFLVIGAG